MRVSLVFGINCQKLLLFEGGKDDRTRLQGQKSNFLTKAALGMVAKLVGEGRNHFYLIVKIVDA
ncbi:hypothetical protein [Raoultella terrigena]|uniref:hypothetical protein n=1 Tax=Raoultella terrigena TaxID=577 RepID=UPI001F35DBFE|nr:hypothetical protein [Raoultella terrigena]